MTGSGIVRPEQWLDRTRTAEASFSKRRGPRSGVQLEPVSVMPMWISGVWGSLRVQEAVTYSEDMICWTSEALREEAWV